MTWKHHLALLVLVGVTFILAWQATSPKSYLRYPSHIQRKKDSIEKLKQQNEQLYRKILAFRYDNRIIEREARDQLGLFHKGEYVIYISRKKTFLQPASLTTKK